MIPDSDSPNGAGRARTWRSVLDVLPVDPAILLALAGDRFAHPAPRPTTAETPRAEEIDAVLFWLDAAITAEAALYTPDPSSSPIPDDVRPHMMRLHRVALDAVTRNREILLSLAEAYRQPPTATLH